MLPLKGKPKYSSKISTGGCGAMPKLLQLLKRRICYFAAANALGAGQNEKSLCP
jgi:hypothetical protein